MKRMSDERRQDERVPIRTQAEVRFPSWEMFERVWTTNISRGGMALALQKPPDPGAPLSVKLVLPDGSNIELEGVVKYARPLTTMAPHGEGGGSTFRIGVEFVNLDADRREKLEALLKGHLKP
jgi:hypothetical protein